MSVKLGTAEAVIILANARSSDQHAEDMANILRVISVKNYCPSRRIIVQILHFQNKVGLVHVFYIDLLF